MRRPVLSVIAAAVALHAGGRLSAQDEPLPVPLIEREEVRLVTLDVVVEGSDSGAGGGWGLARDLLQENFEVLVGRQPMSLDLFENWCAPDEAKDGVPQESPVVPSKPMVSARSEAPHINAPPYRYVLYFDLEHLNLHGRNAAFAAARHWAKTVARPSDQVMIITAGRGLRIVRQMAPASDRLTDDLEAASEDFRSSELWAMGEADRIEEIRDALRRNEHRPLIATYKSIDYAKTRNSLENLAQLMTIFDSIEGTKNLLLFADTIRQLPGKQYILAVQPFINLTELPSDVNTQLDTLSTAANERNVRIYPVIAGVESRADDALTMLAEATGGRYVDGTNRLDVAFDRVSEDLACYYRLGFRIQPHYTGRAQPIAIRIRGRAGKFRLRHRRSLDDPTREQREADLLRAALIAPSNADEFPMSVTAKELYRHERGSRLRVEVSASLADLVPLPTPGSATGSLQVRVQMGGQIVPMRDDTAMVGRPSTDDVWNGVALDEKSLGFARQAVLTIPRAALRQRGERRVVYVEEFDAPAGRYRIIAVVQDQLAMTIAADVTDYQAEGTPTLLSPIGLAAPDPHALILAGNEEENDSHTKSGDEELALTRPILPAGSLIVDGTQLEADRPIHFFYAVCGAEANSRLNRSISCGASDPIVLIPRLVPDPEPGERCVPLVETVPADRLTPGSCRFDVSLQRGVGLTQNRSVTFVVGANRTPGLAGR